MITISPTGTGDDTAMINAAVALLPSRGGTILFQTGTYDLPGGSINLAGKTAVTLKGEGGISAGADTPTVIRGTGMTRLIDLRSSIGCAAEDMMLLCADGSTGKLVDACGTAQAPTSHPRVERCTLIGTPPSGIPTAKGVDLNAAICGQVIGCNFNRLERGVGGRLIGSFSNAHALDRNVFIRCQYAVLYAGEAWSIDHCTFECDYLNRASGFMTIAQLPFKGLTMTGNWFGDATAPGGPGWVTVYGEGFSYRGGNRMAGLETSYGILIYDLKGYDISGNEFQTLKAVSFQSANNSDGNVSDNAHNIAANMLNAPQNRGARVNIVRNSGATEYPYPP